MNLMEILKQKTLRLMGLLLCIIPVTACYTVLRLLGCAATAATLATVLFSGVAYVLLLPRIEAFLRNILPFFQPKPRNRFEAANRRLEHSDNDVAKGPNLYADGNKLEVGISLIHAARSRGGGWVQAQRLNSAMRTDAEGKYQ